MAGPTGAPGCVAACAAATSASDGAAAVTSWLRSRSLQGVETAPHESLAGSRSTLYELLSAIKGGLHWRMRT